MPPDCYPRIAPVASSGDRPFWSVMIPTFNRPYYLEQALASVLAQDFAGEAAQIEVLDNCSTEGDIAAIVSRVGQGRVRYFRQPGPVPPVANMNCCVERSIGHWVHIMHDDDLLLPGFYVNSRRCLQAHPDAAMVFSRAIMIDESGEWLHILRGPPSQHSAGVVANALRQLFDRNFIVAPSAIVSRRQYEVLGGWNSTLNFAPDYELWLRLAASAAIGYVHQPSFLYRSHPGRNTFRVLVAGGVIEEQLQVVETALRTLPPEQQRASRKAAHVYISRLARDYYQDLLAEGHPRLASAYAWRSLRLRPAVGNLLHLLGVVALLPVTRCWSRAR